LVATTLSACGATDFFGEDTEVPLPGNRVPILLTDEGLTADEGVAEIPVILPRPYINTDWPQPGGQADKSNGHLDVADGLREVWSRSIGSGGDDEQGLVAQPVIADGRLFALDSDTTLTALNAADGARLWSRDLRPEDEDDAVFPGGVTTGDGRIFVTTGYGEAIALSPETGAELWRVSLPGPARGAPGYGNNQLFAVTIENRLFALSAETGERLWDHQGISEVTSLLGGAAPAISGPIVLVPYTSGELFALRAENGRVQWLESLTNIRMAQSVARLADIRGNPVIDENRAFAISNGGLMAAIDLATGARIWERAIGGVSTPWVAGEFVFVMGEGAQLVALTRRDGRARWVTQLPPFEDMEDREGPIQYVGPVLAGDRLLVGDSLGQAYAVSPYTGDILGRIDVGDDIFVSPIVAGGTIYFLTDDGNIHAWR
jgi:outer membrane protein assembly factor BamB